MKNTNTEKKNTKSAIVRSAQEFVANPETGKLARVVATAKTAEIVPAKKSAQKEEDATLHTYRCDFPNGKSAFMTRKHCEFCIVNVHRSADGKREEFSIIEWTAYKSAVNQKIKLFALLREKMPQLWNSHPLGLPFETRAYPVVDLGILETRPQNDARDNHNRFVGDGYIAPVKEKKTKEPKESAPQESAPKKGKKESAIVTAKPSADVFSSRRAAVRAATALGMDADSIAENEDGTFSLRQKKIAKKSR